MTAPSSTVSALGAMLSLLATSPDDRDRLKTAFRNLYSYLEPRGATIATDVHGVLLDGTPLPHGILGADVVRTRYHAHGIGMVRVPAGVKAPDLLAVVRLLAAEPLEGPSVEAFVQRLPVEAALAIQVEGPRALPQAGDVRTLDRLDVNIGAGSAARVGAPEPTERVRRDQPELDPIRDIELAADQAYRREEWDDLLALATQILQLEAEATDEGLRRRYGVTLKRALPRSALQHIARAALAEGNRVEATAVLRRMGSDAVEALLELLTAAPTIGERRGYFSVLTRMDSGSDRIVHRLDHPDWFVVRNVAELCGELKLADSVRGLSAQAAHRDERVRRAVAGALGKIGAPEGSEALRRLLHDTEPMVRLQAAQGIGGSWARGLVSSMAVRLPEEAHPDVLRELHLALGRVGTAEAVQALKAAAAPARGFLGRKPLAGRVAAVEGLALAGGPAAAGALQDLLGDGDDGVRAAAAKALGGKK